MGFHPLRRLLVASSPHAVAANHILGRAGVGSTLPFEVLRKQDLRTLSVTLTKQGIPRFTQFLYWDVGFLALVQVMVQQQMATRWLGRLWLFAVFAVLVGPTTTTDVRYTAWVGLRDVALITSFVLIFVPAKPWWFAPFTIRLPWRQPPVPAATPVESEHQESQRWGDAVRALRRRWSESPRLLPAACIAAALVYVLYLWHVQTPLPEDIGPIGDYASLAGLRVKLFARGVIPPIILWTLLVGLHYLWQIWRTKLAPLSPMHVQNRAICRAAAAGDGEALTAAINAQSSHGQLGYYGRRVYQLIEQLNRDPDRAALMSLSTALLTEDEEDASRAFVPVTWCEAALPLWGFLGTIVGMGDAIGVLAHAVLAIFQGSTSTDISGDFTQAFQGMGVAFDTTFWGLVGVLTLSAADRALRKRIATRLAEVRALLGRLISQWSASSVAGELVEVNVRLHGVAAELEHAKAFRETVHTLVERVITEVPGYEPIRDALFATEVVFEPVLAGLGTAMIEPITAQLREAAWHFPCVGLPVSAAAGGVVAVRHGQGNEGDWLQRFDPHAGPIGALLQTPYRFQHLLPARDLQTVLGRTTDGQLLLLALPPEGEGAVESTSVLKNGDTLDDETDAVLPLTVEQQDIAVIVRRTGEQAYDVLWREIQAAGPPELKSLGPLPAGFAWTKWSVHGPSAMLLVAGHAGDRWQLLRLPIQKRNTRAGRGAPLELVTDFNRWWVELPPGVVPQQIVALPQEALLVLDTQGTLHYWHPTRYLRPVRSHPDWRRMIGPHNAQACEIRSGSGHWIAVVAQDKLSMWWVSRSRALSPYVNPDDVPPRLVTFDITDRAAQQSVQATADGKHLLTVMGQAIPTWAFPRYTIDDLA